MQAYAACDDPEIREVVRNGYGDLFAYVERVKGDLPASARFPILRHRDAPQRDRVDGLPAGRAGRAWVGRLLEEGIKHS